MPKLPEPDSLEPKTAPNSTGKLWGKVVLGILVLIFLALAGAMVLAPHNKGLNNGLFLAFVLWGLVTVFCLLTFGQEPPPQRKVSVAQHKFPFSMPVTSRFYFSSWMSFFLGVVLLCVLTALFFPELAENNVRAYLAGCLAVAAILTIPTAFYMQTFRLTVYKDALLQQSYVLKKTILFRDIVQVHTAVRPCNEVQTYHLVVKHKGKATSPWELQLGFYREQDVAFLLQQLIAESPHAKIDDLTHALSRGEFPQHWN